MNWLANDEHLINLQPRAAKDSNIILSKSQLTLISVSFLLVLPLILLIRGLLIWWKRRRS
jgi:ABC-type uncharacterized transport system involved in gliding motility auxiliary subunit